MPPKAKSAAAAKPEAKAKGEPKKKREPREEDKYAAEIAALEKVEQPDGNVHKEEVAKITSQIEKLQREQKEMTDKINERSGGKTEFFQKKQEIRAKLDQYSAEMNTLQGLKDEIIKSTGDQQQQGRDMQDQLKKMKKSIGFGSESEIDSRIADLEMKMQHETLSLKEEKDLLKEIQELKRNRPKVSQVNRMEDEAKTKLQAGAGIKERKAEINEKLAYWRDLKKAENDKLTELMQERKDQLGDLPDIIADRDKKGDEIKKKIQERNELRDAFKAKEREYYEYKNEIRKIQQKRIQEEKQSRQKEYDQRRKEKAAEALDDQPHVSEMTLIEQTIVWCKSLIKKDDEKQEDKKAAAPESIEGGGTVLLRKEDREEEFYFAPTAKGKKSKSKNKGGEAGGGKAKPIKHNADTFRFFDQLKLDAPITLDDIPPTIEKLEALYKEFEKKVEDWKENRDEMKRKIMSGEYVPEAEEKKEEPAAAEKEEEKEAEKEEEKEEEKDDAEEEKEVEKEDDEAEKEEE